MITIYGNPSKKLNKNEFVKRLNSLEYAGQQPLHESAFKILGALSKECFSAPIKAEAPQLIALGFWLRQANLKRIAMSSGVDNHGSNSEKTWSRNCARGIAFHLPPANVDTLFVYTWALSLLAGNTNIVRLPTTMNPTGTWLISTIYKILEEANQTERNLFCHFEKEGGFVELISEHSDLRMIWGGDAKVKLISQYPVRPDGLSLGFPDRHSISVVSEAAYTALSDTEKDTLAEKFFNDVFWFDQMGCSSPRALLWCTEGKRIDKVKVPEDFYERLQKVIQSKGYETPVGIAIAKFAFMNERIIEHGANYGKRVSNELSISSVNQSIDLDISKFNGGGHLYDCFIGGVSDIIPLTNRATQTISYFGLSNKQLSELSEGISSRGGYRIVPIGTALDFNETWDGVALLSHMCRKIIIQSS